ncbi:TMEM165/GDT1 family protein [Candidatus Woesearchaeota archaeon]|nr:TMEM165/GDT1 family protein [Candidatus Woesearchaeota archaeon]MBI2574369.1 TMEM165/GDT1 family protein [Candidatus Woesearchaeota archaeon]
MLKDLFLPAVTVGVSELGDKTQLAVLFGAAASELIPFRIIMTVGIISLL